MYNTVYIILIRHCKHLLVVVYKFLSCQGQALRRRADRDHGPTLLYLIAVIITIIVIVMMVIVVIVIVVMNTI